MRVPAALLFAVLAAYTALLAAAPFTATTEGPSVVTSAVVVFAAIALMLGVMLTGRPTFRDAARRGALVGLGLVLIGFVMLFVGDPLKGSATGAGPARSSFLGLDNRNLVLGMLAGLGVFYAAGFAIAHRMVQKGTVKGAEDVIADPGAAPDARPDQPR